MTEISGQLPFPPQAPFAERGSVLGQIEAEREKTNIYFLRHAPTKSSAEHRVQGKIDTDILSEGAAAYLEKVGARDLQKPDLIVVSGLKRTQQTADVLKELRGWSDLPMIEDTAFNERSWGIFEGKTHEEIREMIFKDQVLPDKYPYLKAGEFERIWSDWDFKVDGSESLNELRVRVNAGMIELNKKYPGKNILLVTHIGVLQTQEIDSNSISKVSVGRNSSRKEIVSKN